LTVDHIEQLLLPVLTGSRVMNIGLRDRGAFIAKITHHLPLISGERALRREVVESIPPELMQGFMIETALNFTCRARGYAYGAVMLRDLRIRRKYEKVGYVRGVLQYIRMVYEVLLAHVAVRLVK
jgi:polyisoprenyl-phosphate glycosyltransferase